MTGDGVGRTTRLRLTTAGPFAAVAALGALVLHQLGYALASAGGHVHTGGDHNHLAAQWAVVTPLAVMGAVALVVRQIGQLGFGTSRSAPLAGASAALYVLQESVEGALAGSVTGTVLSLPVLLGVLLAPAVAAAIVRLLADVAEVVARFVTTREPISVPLLTFARPVDRGCRPQLALVVAPSRGPPHRMA